MGGAFRSNINYVGQEIEQWSRSRVHTIRDDCTMIQRGELLSQVGTLTRTWTVSARRRQDGSDGVGAPGAVLAGVPEGAGAALAALPPLAPLPRLPLADVAAGHRTHLPVRPHRGQDGGQDKVAGGFLPAPLSRREFVMGNFAHVESLLLLLPL